MLQRICLVLIISLGVTLAVTPQQRSLIQSKLLDGGLDCVQEYPLSLSEIRDFQRKILPDKENARCFTACLFKKIGLMNDMGKLDADKIGMSAAEIFKDSKEQVENSKAYIQECSKVNDHSVSDGAKGCDRAKLAFDCLKDNAPKYGFDIGF